MLILLNGTRYHNQAWYFQGLLRGQLGKGSAGNDLNFISFSAIEKVEILRDDASAQCGSDEIAGVINIRLKETTGKTSILLQQDNIMQAMVKNFPLVSIHREKSFVNFSAGYRYQLTVAAYTRALYIHHILTMHPHGDSFRIKATDDSIFNARGFNLKSVLGNAGTFRLRSCPFFRQTLSEKNKSKNVCNPGHFENS